MRIIRGLAAISILSGCALTAPDGEKQLSKAIEDDRARANEFRDVHIGRPKFIKVRAYKQVQNGDIHESHWIYLQVGRERLDIDNLIN